MVRMKRTIGPSEKLYPMPVPLIVGMADGAVDVLAAAWIGTVCGAPPTVAVGLRKVRRTLKLIEASGELTINIPTTSMAAVVDYCGTVPGGKRDKFADTGLTLTASSVVSTPIIAECPRTRPPHVRAHGLNSTDPRRLSCRRPRPSDLQRQPGDAPA